MGTQAGLSEYWAREGQMSKTTSHHSARSKQPSQVDAALLQETGGTGAPSFHASLFSSGATLRRATAALEVSAATMNASLAAHTPNFE